MMTSRTEYRLLHREDNADGRLTQIGFELGLISSERLAEVEKKYADAQKEIRRLESTGTAPSPELDKLLADRGETPVANGARLLDLLRRPKISYADLKEFDPNRPELSIEVQNEVEVAVKYEGYITRQSRLVDEMRKLENYPLPADLNYSDLIGLRLEARQKLDQIRPVNLGQASRVSGVSPADVAVLMTYLRK